MEDVSGNPIETVEVEDMQTDETQTVETTIKETHPAPTEVTAPQCSPAKRPKVPQGPKPTNTEINKAKKGQGVRSWAWDHFTKESKVEGDKTPRAVCNWCQCSFSCDSSNGTSTMSTHLQKRCKKYPNKQIDKGQSTLRWNSKNDGEPGSLMHTTFSVEACRRALAEMVILDELPFRNVEKIGFKRFMSVVCPKWTKHPSRVTVKEDCMTLYRKEKSKLKSALKGQRVCLTTDTWTSIQNISYMVLTAHFIDCDWKLHKRILNFCLVESHKGEMLGRLVEMCLIGWDLDKILTLTVDNASSNSVLVSFLKKKLKSRKFTILEHQFLHVRCCAHILNLVVGDGLKEYDESIVKVRNAVRYVRASPSRFSTFQLCAQKEGIPYKGGLCLDVPTRWNSTYLMLVSAEKYQKAFERLEEDDTNYPTAMNSIVIHPGIPDSYDWERVRMFGRFLKLFYDATLRFSGSSHVTANNFFDELMDIRCEINSMCSSDDHSMRFMAEAMKEKFEKYWGNIDNMNMLLFVAVVLDPRYKMRYVKYCFAQVLEAEAVQGVIWKVQDALNRVYEWYRGNEVSGTNLQGLHASSTSQNPQESSGQQGTTRPRMFSQFQKHLAEEESLGSQSEVDKYLRESCEPPQDNFEILG